MRQLIGNLELEVRALGEKKRNLQARRSELKERLKTVRDELAAPILL